MRRGTSSCIKEGVEGRVYLPDSSGSWLSLVLTPWIHGVVVWSQYRVNAARGRMDCENGTSSLFSSLAESVLVFSRGLASLTFSSKGGR